MVNYYEKLDIDKNLSTDEINKKLVELDVLWTKRSNNNQNKARPMLLLISEAQDVFRTETSRKEYDESLGLHEKGSIKRDIPESKYIPPINNGDGSNNKEATEIHAGSPISETNTTSSSGGGCLWFIIKLAILVYIFCLVSGIANYYETRKDTNNNTSSNNVNNSYYNYNNNSLNNYNFVTEDLFKFNVIKE